MAVRAASKYKQSQICFSNIMQTFCLKEYLYYNLVVVQYLGAWPKNDYFLDKFYLLYTIIVNGFFNLGIAIALLGYILTSTQTLEDVTAIGYFTLGVVATVKSLFIVKYSKMFKGLVDSEVYKSVKVNLSDKQNKILCNYLSFRKKLYLFFSYLSTMVVIGFVITPVFIKTPNTLPLSCWCPFDYKKPVIYEIVYAHQSISILMNVFIKIHGGTLTAGFRAYVIAEFNVLVDLLQNLNKETKYGDDILDVEELKTCIEYHKKIVEYSEMLQSYLSYYLLVQFITSGMTTALLMTSLSRIYEINVNSLFMIVLQLAVWADVYIYCWYGNEVTTKSDRIPYAAFESNWVTASKEFRKDLQFFIHRTQKPIKLYAINFFELSLDTFIRILKSAWSYFMVLRELSNNN